jgi:hypothetical protein
MSITALEPTAYSFGFAYASGGGSPRALCQHTTAADTPTRLCGAWEEGSCRAAWTCTSEALRTSEDSLES